MGSELTDRITAILAQPSPHIAIDTASFQAADSYLITADNQTDPEARKTFTNIATWYCNAAFLHIPLPHGPIGKEPALLHGWAKPYRTDFTARPVIESDVEEELQNFLATNFCTYVNTNAATVAKWAAFQFTPTIRGQYFSRAEAADVYRMETVTNHLVEQQRLQPFLTALAAEQQAGNLNAKTPEEYGVTDVPLLTLVAMYTFSIYVRGWHYASSLSQVNEHPRYEHLWLREQALADNPFDTHRVESSSPPLFPWGALLATIFDPQQPVLPRDPQRAFALMQQLHEQAPTILSYVLNDKEPELAFADQLLKLGIVPQYLERRERKIILSVATWAAGALAVPFGWWGFAAQAIVALLPQTPYAAAIDARVALRFQRTQFWTLFKDPGARATLQQWELKQQTANAALLRATA